MQNQKQIQRPMKKRRYTDAFGNQSEFIIPSNESYLLMSENELLSKLNNLENLFTIMMNNIQELNNELIKIENQIEDIKDSDEITSEDTDNLEILDENNFDKDDYINSYFS